MDSPILAPQLSAAGTRSTFAPSGIVNKLTDDWPSPNLFTQMPPLYDHAYNSTMPLSNVPSIPVMSFQPSLSQTFSSNDSDTSDSDVPKRLSPGGGTNRSNSDPGPTIPFRREKSGIVIDLNARVQGSLRSNPDGVGCVFVTTQGHVLAEPPGEISIRRKACDACNGRKLRCTGGVPCTRCIKNDIVCRHPVLLERTEDRAFPKVAKSRSSTSSGGLEGKPKRKAKKSNSQVSPSAPVRTVSASTTHTLSEQIPSQPASRTSTQTSLNSMPDIFSMLNSLPPPILHHELPVMNFPSGPYPYAVPMHNPWQDQLALENSRNEEQVRMSQLQLQIRQLQAQAQAQLASLHRQPGQEFPYPEHEQEEDQN
jgi:hypothetical protein